MRIVFDKIQHINKLRRNEIFYSKSERRLVKYNIGESGNRVQKSAVGNIILLWSVRKAKRIVLPSGRKCCECLDRLYIHNKR